MAVSLPNGSLVHMGTLAVAVAITVATNATQAVFTAAGHGLSVGEYFVYEGGWTRASGKVYQAAVVSGNDVTAKLLNTTNTTTFSAGTGLGTLKRITAWTQISQVLGGVTTDGGEQQYTTFKFLEEDFERSLPTVKSARGLNFNIADDDTLPGWQALAAANDDRVDRPLRVTLPSGARLLYFGPVSFNKTPTLNDNEVMANEASMRLTEPVRYAAGA